MDSICISDLHLGSDVCEHKRLEYFLYLLADGGIKTKELILNGDVFDHSDFKKFKRKDWNIVDLLNKITKKLKIIWIKGNHDSPWDKVKNLINAQEKYADYYINDKSMMFIHGDRFDTFLNNNHFLEYVGDKIYNFLQKIDSSHNIARWVKKLSKTCLKIRDIVRMRATEFAEKYNCTKVICGHTHFVENGPIYYNDGCWTEKPCNCIVIEGNNVYVREFP